MTKVFRVRRAGYLHAALSALVAVVVVAAAQADPNPLATFQLGTGWATFGLALPESVATAGVRVGNLQTQTDVKTRWPDGSIRFAVVTARVERDGAYQLVAGEPDTGAFGFGAWPRTSVQFWIDGGVWVATLPAVTSDRWLSGPLVSEARAVVAPTQLGQPHPFLRVVFDVRSFVGGGYRLDVTVESSLNVAAAAAVTYDVVINTAGETVFQKRNLTHPYLARWRRTFTRDLRESSVATDFAPFISARAVPAYLPTVNDTQRPTDAAKFDVLSIGSLHDPMSDHGGRPELAPYPDWTAQYLVHARPDQKAYVLRHGELAGSYSIHLKEPDGVRLVTIDAHPDFWFDARAGVVNGPANLLRGVGFRADNAHQPSLAYVPYLVTGDRYYADEMKYWANFCLLYSSQYQPNNPRGRSLGYLTGVRGGEVRAIGWTLRNLADAAAYLPDDDSYKPYFAEKIANNLAYLEEYARTFDSPLGSLFTGHRNNVQSPYALISMWEQNFAAWGVDRALQHGFMIGQTFRDRIARFQLRLLTSDAEGYPRRYNSPYELAIGTREAGGVNYFRTMGEVFRATYPGSLPPEPIVGHHGPDNRLMLIVAKRLNFPGAQDAYEYLMQTTENRVSLLQDLNLRSGWAVVDPADRAGLAGRPLPATGSSSQ